MPATRQERGRIRALVTDIFVEGYTDGVTRVATRYGLEDAIPGAARSMGGRVSARLDLVDKAIDSYLEAIEQKARGLRAAGIEGTRLFEEVTRYADHLAANKAELIAKTEWATARFNGAKEIVDESGEPFEWRFPHFDNSGQEHEECEICEAIREGGPYTTEEAEDNGYPDLPHLNCDHGWVLVPKGEQTRTEEHPMGPAEVEE